MWFAVATTFWINMKSSGILIRHQFISVFGFRCPQVGWDLWPRHYKAKGNQMSINLKARVLIPTVESPLLGHSWSPNSRFGPNELSFGSFEALHMKSDTFLPISFDRKEIKCCGWFQLFLSSRCITDIQHGLLGSLRGLTLPWPYVKHCPWPFKINMYKLQRILAKDMRCRLFAKKLFKGYLFNQIFLRFVACGHVNYWR